MFDCYVSARCLKLCLLLDVYVGSFCLVLCLSGNVSARGLLLCLVSYVCAFCLVFCLMFMLVRAVVCCV